MRKILFISVLILLAACNSAKKGTSGSSAKYSLENLGKMDSEDLKLNYPDAQVEEGTDLFEVGTEERAYTVLYPGTENELHITWQDRARNDIYDIRYSGTGKWESETGVKVGMTYEDLTRLNGKPVSFYGFGWDYSGAVLWNGGKLEDSGLRVFLQPEKEVSNKYYGDHIIKASEEEIKNLDLKVGTIMINYSI